MTCAFPTCPSKGTHFQLHGHSEAFFGFPKSHNIAYDNPEDLLRLPPGRLAEVLQTWLFFGLLANIIGRNFKDSEFIHVEDGSGEKYVTLKRLGELCRAVLPSTPRNHWDTVLDRTRTILHMLESHETKAKEQLSLVAFSISLLLDYIRFGQDWWSWKEWDVPDGLWKTVAVPRKECLFKHQPLADCMIGPAWCPFCKRQYDFYGTAVFCLLSTLERPTFPSGFVDHSENCSADNCVANSTDKNDYTVRHRENRCQCRPPVIKGDLIRILRSGKVPPVEVVTDSSSEGVYVKLQEMRTATEYVAISHVWSHGMANPKANSLPLCQIKHLAKVVRATSGSPTLFWMDTLCIPVDDRHEYLRKACIDKMGLVYAGAKSVLILDLELECLKHRDLHPSQILGHILCCT
jgi:Heterokaryon incompatibility protein (HET)